MHRFFTAIEEVMAEEHARARGKLCHAAPGHFCPGCGVLVEICPDCGGRGYHAADCAESEEAEPG